MQKTRALPLLVQGKRTCVDFGLDPREVDVAERAEKSSGVMKDGSASLGELSDFREGSEDSCKEKNLYRDRYKREILTTKEFCTRTIPIALTSKV